MQDAHAHVDPVAGHDTDLARVAALARRAWPVLLAAAAAAAALALFAGSRSGATYQAQARLLVGPLEGQADVLRASGQQAQTLSQLATSRTVVDAARQRLGRRAPATDLTPMIQGNATGDTRVVAITARASSAASAAAVANAVADELAALMRTRGQPLAPGQARIVDPAVAPAHPEGTADTTLAALAALAGLLVALSFLLLGDSVRGRVLSEDDLREVPGVMALGTVGRARGRRGRPMTADADSEAAEAHRLLAARLAYSTPDERRRSLVVCGVQSGEGSGGVAADLAAALIADGSRVVLVDADAANAEVTHLFRLEGRPGLGELLDQPAHAPASLRESRAVVECGPGLHVVPCGSLGADISPTPNRMARALGRLVRAGDVVIVSAGPVGAAPATLGWARVAEGAVLLVRRGRTRRDELRRAVDALEQVEAGVVGAVLVEPARHALRPRAYRRPQRARRGAAPASAPAAPRPEGAG